MKTKLSLVIYGEMFALDLEMVMYLEADDHYTIVYYSSGIHFMLPFCLSKVEEAIKEKVVGETYLMRFSRKYMVNLDYVYHINVTKQIIQLCDNKGASYSLRIPKLVLRNFLDGVKKKSLEKS